MKREQDQAKGSPESMPELKRNELSGTPIELLASVLEQRYSRPGFSEDKLGAPDPMSFPAVQKALGGIYSEFVEVESKRRTADETEACGSEQSTEEKREYVTKDNKAVQAEVSEMTDEVLSLINDIEIDLEREKTETLTLPGRRREKRDPYNRSSNIMPPEETEGITEIPLDSGVEIESTK